MISELVATRASADCNSRSANQRLSLLPPHSVWKLTVDMNCFERYGQASLKPVEYSDGEYCRLTISIDLARNSVTIFFTTGRVQSLANFST